jgi:hypothetical protein
MRGAAKVKQDKRWSIVRRFERRYAQRAMRGISVKDSATAFGELYDFGLLLAGKRNTDFTDNGHIGAIVRMKSRLKALRDEG